MIRSEEGEMIKMEAYKWGGPRQTLKWANPFFPTPGFRSARRPHGSDDPGHPPPTYEESMNDDSLPSTPIHREGRERSPSQFRPTHKRETLV
ncbi:hypothetical protein FOZ63_020456 [Perkinsus olseni]|nr:hypothetical protein FOZ63_020456 [Perkinsus olseni]